MPNCSIQGNRLLNDLGAVLAERSHRGPSADGNVLQHGWAGQSRLPKEGIKLAPDVVVHTSATKRLGGPVLNLLPESDPRPGG